MIRYLADNYILFMVTIGLLIIIQISAHISGRMRHRTTLVLLLLLLETVCFSLEKWTQTFEKLSIWRPILTYTVYSVYPFLIIVMMNVISDKIIPRKIFALLVMPAILSVPLYFTSQQTHLVCYFHEENVYAAGPLKYWPYVIISFYALVFLVNNILFFRKYSRADRLVGGYIVVGPLLGVYLLKAFETENDYAEMMVAAIVLYYLYMYIHMAKIDPLTKLLNRQSYYRDIAIGDKVSAVVSADLNELKYLNDNFGHEAGDKALKTIGEILWDNGTGSSVYRIGGDEFLLLFRNKGIDEVKSVVDNIRADIEKKGYSCALGFTERKKDESIEDAVRRADRLMYEDKAAIKASMKEKGRDIHFRD